MFIKKRCKTLTDNIFHNGIFDNIQSGNILRNISDHLYETIFVPSEKNNNTDSDIFQHMLDVACFQDHLRRIDWNTFLHMELNDTNKLSDNFFMLVNDLLDTYAPHKRISLREIKLKKTWLTNDIVTSIKAKNRLYRKLYRSKDEAIKRIYTTNSKIVGITWMK